MSSIAVIRAEVEARLAKRVPAAFAPHLQPEKPAIMTGLDAIDKDVGGIPLGSITEIVAPAWTSTGQKTLQTHLLAYATNPPDTKATPVGKPQARFCALIDATDSFDPSSAAAIGVNLTRLLWVRCSGHGLKALEQAFKCVDLLLQGSGGFGVIVVDISGIAEKWIRKVPLTSWFRFSRVVERLETALVFSMPCRAAPSCTALRLTMRAGHVQWSSTSASQQQACCRPQWSLTTAAPTDAKARDTESSPPHSRLLAGFDFSVESTGKRSAKKQSQRAVPSVFTSAYTKWA